MDLGAESVFSPFISAVVYQAHFTITSSCRKAAEAAASSLKQRFSHLTRGQSPSGVSRSRLSHVTF